jgi:hypothetical protein
MILILLPNTNIYLPEQLPCTTIAISQSINYYLKKIKMKTNEKNVFTQFINIYNDCSKIKGLSPSFFIFIELIQHFNLSFKPQNISYYTKGGDIDWGIIQAFSHNDKTNRFTINAPLPTNIEKGCGKEEQPEEQQEQQHDGLNICWNQESDANITILDEFSILVIQLQKIGTTLILKIEDIFDDYNVKILYYLCSVYNKVFVTKPLASWGGSSTKYVVCNYYKGTLYKNIVVEHLTPTNLFLMKISELNCIYGESQIDTLLGIFSKIDKPDKLNLLIKTYQQRCISWFIKHQIEYIVSPL